jgi:hypothetical protein
MFKKMLIKIYVIKTLTFEYSLSLFFVFPSDCFPKSI